MSNQNPNHCPICGRCFCSVAKTAASNGATVCVICKPQYEQQLQQTIKR
jgi:hypothetical protein